jgi:4-aminobutyrate aminotransferase/(S)-3-amino-2-methylpropionate transaminase
LELLQRYESRNVTFVEEDGSWPIVWQRAQGVHVWDDGGRKYLDLTGAFGVAVAGHANRKVVQAASKQMHELLHAMGDVHPHAGKAELARELSDLTFGRWRTGEGKVIFANSGFEAVEAALKTAFLATGESKVIAFEGAYHGLGYGALNATHRSHFREPFRRQLAEFATFVPFPEKEEEMLTVEKALLATIRSGEFGAILVEPVQARGGIRIPPKTFLPLLQRVAHAKGMLLILDEIYTGFARTGRWFGCEHTKTVPDLICLGKALTGGFPLSACVGKSALMDAAWPASTGEAMHTSTFLGHPVGCAMAFANIQEIRRLDLPSAAQVKGKLLLSALKNIRSRRFNLEVRGVGLMAGIEIKEKSGRPATETALAVIKKLLHRGFIFLPEGEHSNVVSFTPPLTITAAQLRAAVVALKQEIETL